MAYARTIMGGGTGAGQALAIIGGATAAISGAGTTYADAYQLPALDTIMLTGGAGNSGVKLAAGSPGDSVFIYNKSGQTIFVYPPTGAAINALTVTTQEYSFATAKSAIFKCISATQWATLFTA
jgi:hypothetical protein